jgi:hypothetical protein
MAGEVAHGGEDREDLLRMVQHIVGFLPDLPMSTYTTCGSTDWNHECAGLSWSPRMRRRVWLGLVMRRSAGAAVGAFVFVAAAI